jgi:hypothetical protein
MRRLVKFVVVIIETKVFQKLVDRLLSVDERLALLDTLMKTPEAGDVIPKGGGARKLRFGAGNKGKRGGLRVIYVWSQSRAQVLCLLVYPKADKSDLTQEETMLIAKEAKQWV